MKGVGIFLKILSAIKKRMLYYTLLESIFMLLQWKWYHRIMLEETHKDRVPLVIRTWNELIAWQPTRSAQDDEKIKK